MQLHERNQTGHGRPSSYAIRRPLFILAILTGTVGISWIAEATDVGNLIQFQPDTTALAAEVNSNLDDIKTAVNSKQDQATVPGIDFVSSAGSTFLNETTASTISTVTFTVPGAGIVETSFSAQTFINHVTTGNPLVGNGVSCQIERDGSLAGSSNRGWNVLGTEPTGGRNRPISVHVAFNEAAAGTITITVTCIKQGTATASVSKPTLTARFFEQRY